MVASFEAYYFTSADTRALQKRDPEPREKIELFGHFLDRLKVRREPYKETDLKISGLLQCALISIIPLRTFTIKHIHVNRLYMRKSLSNQYI